MITRSQALALAVTSLLLVPACSSGFAYRAGAPSASATSAKIAMGESYDKEPENRFIDAEDEPLSTFAIDVDTASYTNVRRFLREGRLPPPEAVRPEELLNYFEYQYAEPRGADPIAVTAEVADCPWEPRNRLVMIGLKAREVERRDSGPRNLVFLVDTSGSMADQNKLPLVQSALRLVAKKLSRDDTLSIVTYSADADVVVDRARGDEQDTILDALAELRAGGGTNGAAGLEAAYDVADRAFIRGGVNRIIVATDGDFNVGRTSRSDLIDLVEHERERGVHLSVLGLGTGNLKDSNLELLADRGNGNYTYVDSMSEARRVLVQQADGTFQTVAKDVKVQVEFNPRHVRSYRLIGYENRMLGARDFGDDRVDAGEMGAGHTVTALYEIEPTSGDYDNDDRRNVEPLKYQPPKDQAGQRGDDDRPRDLRAELLTIKLRYKQPDGDRSQRMEVAVVDGGERLSRASDDFRFAAAVALFGQILADSRYVGRASLADATELAKDALGRDPRGYRSEFVRLVADAEALRE